MASRSEDFADVQAPNARRSIRPESARHADLATPDQTDVLAHVALAFAVRCHTSRRRDSNGGSFIEHPLEVARLLRDAGGSEVLVAAGLLHDVMADGDVTVDELNVRFGPDVADLVQAVTDHASTESYRHRKQVLREQVRGASGEAALLFAAEKISEVRELPNQFRRDRTRFGATAPDSRMRHHLRRYHEMRLEHYNESLGMLQRVAPRHSLVKRLASELGDCPIAFRQGAISDRP